MKQSDSDIVCDFFTWHAGGGSYVLTDEYNNVSLENLLFSLSKDYAMIPKSDSSKFLVSYFHMLCFHIFYIFRLWRLYDFNLRSLSNDMRVSDGFFLNLISRKRLPSKWPSQTRHLRRADSIMCCVNSSLSNSAYFDYIPWTFCTKLTFTIKLNLVVKFHCFC